MKKEKIVLAYSGGLDTSVIVPWLQEHYQAEVICVAVDVGQQENFQQVEERAYKIGASKFYHVDKKKEFVEEYLFPTLQAGAKYENKYLLGTSTARPVIAKALVEIAKQEKADYIAHGATGKGNDQVRFELGIKALAPEMKIIAPWRIWNLQSRSDEIAYLEKHGIDLPFPSKKHSYSQDENLFHISHEGNELEQPEKEPNYSNFLKFISPLEYTPEEPEYLCIGFQQGIPVSLNGEKMDGISLLQKLNTICGKHGIGCIDMVENRLVGMKSRGVYETPGGTALYFAHEELERLCLDRETFHKKIELSFLFAKLVYNGQWFTRLRKALSAFIEVTQEYVTGEVTLKLYKGNILLAGSSSPYSLYSEAFSTFEKDEVYHQKDAEGFINLFGLGIKIESLLRNNKK